MKFAWMLLASLVCGSVFAAPISDTDALLAVKIKENEALYQNLHMHPELSNKEAETSKVMADVMTKLGFTVTTGVGGYGVVAVMTNGAGPTALIRTDMDALPVTEQTNLPYASTVPGVMHACGHDMHMAIWLGTAHILANSKDRWSGTLVMIAQPAEEVLTGAVAMINDGLFTRFPKPDYGIGLHITAGGLKGFVLSHPGYIQAAADFFYVKLNGKGTHGAAPQFGISPVEMFAEFQTKINSVLALEKSALEPAILDIGKVIIGTKGNIIPPYGEAEGSIRTYDAKLRTYLKTRLVEIANGIALINNAPAPEVKWTGSTNANYNDPKLEAILRPVWIQLFGQVNEAPVIMGSEDFSEYASGAKIPTMFFNVGTSDKLPPEYANHSPFYAPAFHPAYELGVKAMAEAVIKMQSTKL